MIYLILMLLPILCHLICNTMIKDERLIKIIFCINCFLFTLVSAIRYGVGTDYFNTYGLVFNGLKEGSPYHYEFLFLMLNQFVILCNGDIVMLMFICTIITIPSFFYFIKSNVPQKYWFLSIFLFIGTTIYFASMNVVRQYLAISILLIAYYYLLKDKYVIYLILNFFAILFHTSAVFNLVILPVYLVVKNYNLKKIFIIVYLLSIVAIFIDIRFVFNSLSFIIPERYLGYLNSPFMFEKNYLAALKLILPNILLLVLLIFEKDLKNQNKQYYALFSGWYIYVVLSNALYGINLFIRLGWYFDFYILIIVPMIIELFYQKQYTLSLKEIRIPFSICFTVGVIFYCLLWNSYSIFYKGGQGVLPYHTIFEKELVHENHNLKIT